MKLYLIDNKTAPKSQRYRWQLKAENGKIVAASSEGFSSKRKCAANLWILWDEVEECIDFDSKLWPPPIYFDSGEKVKL